jgi:hypothetical protein
MSLGDLLLGLIAIMMFVFFVIAGINLFADDTSWEDDNERTKKCCAFLYQWF